MTVYSILVLFALATVTCHNMKPFDVNEPLSLTISPKVWSLLETKAVVIENAVKSIKIPDFGKRNWARMGKVSNMKITKFKVPKFGVSFENMNDGVHIKIKGVQLEVCGKAKYRLLFVTSKTKNVAITSNLDADAKLKWRDFIFIPEVKIKTNLKTKLSGILLKIFKPSDKKISRVIDRALEKYAEKIIVEEVNPHLQEFKKKIEAEGLRSYTVQLSVQRNSLHVSIKPKSAGNVITPLNPINNMVCLNANMLALINGIHGRKKRDLSRNHTWVSRGSSSRFQNSKKIDVTCLSPKLDCELSKLTCSLCSDIDIKYTSGTVDEFHNCLPKLPF
ncbi:unnamed protein product [Cylicocyclus nassatus]|uniref:Uncharacterized protein n=1 Tax=Cylicocyclus nassatus TaxID=53992 RepID=A0AA36DRJ2_CYLNA|nr:unnamed protein product [Cylicocyclus nassatus]